MLPSFLDSTYKRYKTDTSTFVKWLFENGTRCGYTPSSQGTPKPEDAATEPAKAPRLKGKARKQSKQAAATGNTPVQKSQTEDHKLVAPKDLLPLARAIVESTSPLITVPTWIIQTGLRAISSRKRCATYFESITAFDDSDTKQSNYTHSYYVSLLEAAILALQPRFAVSSGSISSKAYSQSDDNFEVLVNRFEALDLEESTEQPDGDQQVPVESAGPVYGVETPKDDKAVKAERLFAIFCLFDDLERLRKFAQDLWIDYAVGRVDLITASVTTNASFEIPARTQAELLAAFPDSEDYQTVLAGLLAVLSREGSGKMEIDGGLAQWIFAPVHSLLDTFVDDILQPKHVPLMKRGHFGIYDPTRDRTKLTDTQQQHEDAIVLLEILPEFCFIQRYNIQLFAMDELTHGLSKMIESKKIPIWLTFAVTIFLDIHHILRERVERPFNELQRIGREAGQTLKKYSEFSDQMKPPLTWPKKNEKIVQGLRRDIDFCVLGDVVYPLKDKYYKQCSGVSPTESERFYLYKRHPILCGILAFRTVLELQDAGVILCNAWGTIIFVAQFYNALRKKTDPIQSWPLMEQAISLHTEKQIFVGAAPKNINDSWKQTCLMLGYSASSFAQNRRQMKLAVSKMGPRGLKDTSILGEFFRKGLNTYRVDGSMAFTIHNIEELLNQQAKGSDIATNPQNKALRREWATTKRLSSLQLLQALRDFIPGELAKLKFPYFQMHELSIQLLRRLVVELDEEFKKYIGPRYIENESQLCFVGLYVIIVAFQSKRTAEHIGISAAGSKLLERAGKILEDFVRENE